MNEIPLRCHLQVDLVAPDEDPAWRRWTSLERPVTLPFAPFLGLELSFRPAITPEGANLFNELDQIADNRRGLFTVNRVIWSADGGSVSLYAKDRWEATSAGLRAAEELLVGFYGFSVLERNIREKVSDRAGPGSGGEGEEDTGNTRRMRAVGYWGERLLPAPSVLIGSGWRAVETHYILDHALRLPDEFIETMRRNDWRVPKAAVKDWDQERSQPDYDFWIAWAAAGKDGAD